MVRKSLFGTNPQMKTTYSSLTLGRLRIQIDVNIDCVLIHDHHDHHCYHDPTFFSKLIKQIIKITSYIVGSRQPCDRKVSGSLQNKACLACRGGEETDL